MFGKDVNKASNKAWISPVAPILQDTMGENQNKKTTCIYELKNRNFSILNTIEIRKDCDSLKQVFLRMPSPLNFMFYTLSIFPSLPKRVCEGKKNMVLETIWHAKVGVCVWRRIIGLLETSIIIKIHWNHSTLIST
jgi:hypothetical protein